jgi:hypothetical protein
MVDPLAGLCSRCARGGSVPRQAEPLLTIVAERHWAVGHSLWAVDRSPWVPLPRPQPQALTHRASARWWPHCAGRAAQAHDQKQQGCSARWSSWRRCLRQRASRTRSSCEGSPQAHPPRHTAVAQARAALWLATSSRATRARLRRPPAPALTPSQSGTTVQQGSRTRRCAGGRSRPLTGAQPARPSATLAARQVALLAQEQPPGPVRRRQLASFRRQARRLGVWAPRGAQHQVARGRCAA